MACLTRLALRGAHSGAPATLAGAGARRGTVMAARPPISVTHDERLQRAASPAPSCHPAARGAPLPLQHSDVGTRTPRPVSMRHIETRHYFVAVRDSHADSLASPPQVHVSETRAKRKHQARAAADTNAPLFLIGGTAQLISSYVPHARGFSSAGHRVFTYELRGQGQTSLSRTGASMECHARDFAQMYHALGLRGKVDICGFSFGGKVALAIAAEYPNLVRSVVSTGVSDHRTKLSRALLEEWTTMLEEGDLHGMVRSSMTRTVGEKFLKKNQQQINKWVDTHVQGNDIDGLSLVLREALKPRPGFAMQDLADRVMCPVLLINGENDTIATPKDAQAFAAEHQWSATMVPDCSHAVPVEKPIVWRALVLSFLQHAKKEPADLQPALARASRAGGERMLWRGRY